MKNELKIPHPCCACHKILSTRYKLINHLKKHHNMSLEEHIIISVHDGKHPLCACGCNKQTTYSKSGRKFNTYLRGHNPIEFSEETKKTIGKKNSKNMHRYFDENPDEARRRAQNMRDHRTSDTYVKSSNTLKQICNTPEKKQWASEHWQNVWSNKDLRAQRDKNCKLTYRQRQSEGRYDEMYQKLSEIMVTKLINNERLWQQGEYHSSKCSKICKFKSSYELNIMQQLDASDIVIEWTYEPFFIPYFDSKKNKNRRYVPDFILKTVTNHHCLIEVKPKKLQYRFNHDKISAGQAYCDQNGIQFIVWDIEDGNINSILQSL